MRRGISFERLQSLGYDQAMEQGSGSHAVKINLKNINGGDLLL